MSFRGIIAYSCLAAFWASFFVGLAVVAGDLGFGLSVGIFGTLGGLALLAMAKLAGRTLNWSVDWALVALWAGLGLTILLAVCLAGLLVGAAITAIVVSSIPLFATVVGQMRGLERVTGLGAVSLLLGIGGLMLVAAFPADEASWGFLGGVVAALLAAVAAGSCGRQVAHRLSKPKSLESAILAALIGGVSSFAFIPLNPPSRLSVWPVLIVVALAVSCAFLALFAMSSASDSVSRRLAATLPGVGTVLAVVAGVIVLAEPISVAQVGGMLLVLAGTALLRGLVPRWFPDSWRA
jgi:drug/metabolite transporter (DMT)-like permease